MRLSEGPSFAHGGALADKGSAAKDTADGGLFIDNL